MHYRRLLSSGRRRERGDLCRLQQLAAAARLGTAWLQGETADPAAPGAVPSRARRDHVTLSCRHAPEHTWLRT